MLCVIYVWYIFVGNLKLNKMTTQNTYFSWSTKKTTNGFVAIVTKNTTRDEANEKGQFVDSEVLRVDTLPTRARAKSHAQKWVKYLKATA
jgi:hypothetical protein